MNTHERRELLYREFGIEEIPNRHLRGRCIQRENYETTLRESMEEDKLERLVERGHIDDPNEKITRSRWKIEDPPVFNGGSGFVESHLEES